MKTIVTYAVLALCLTGCRQETPQPPKEVIPNNVDVSFNTFLPYFKSKPQFQKSRVQFPADVTTNHDGKIIKKKLTPKEFRMLHFAPEPKAFINHAPNDFSNHFIIDDSIASIMEIRAKTDVIYAMYNFKRVNGKWMLCSWIDRS